MIDAVIFDKDGTLIDFDAFWVAVSVSAIKGVLEELNALNVCIEEVLKMYGVEKGVTDPNGVLCKGTYEQMGEILHDVLFAHGYNFALEKVTDLLVNSYNKNSDAGEIKPTCEGLEEVLLSLKKRGIKLAVVTTDNKIITEKCLKKLGVFELFDKIYTDDGKIPTKPNPCSIYDFIQTFGIKKESIVMVGDTLTDLEFAKNAGVSFVGVFKNNANRQILEPFADKLVDSLLKLESVI